MHHNPRNGNFGSFLSANQVDLQGGRCRFSEVLALVFRTWQGWQGLRRESCTFNRRRNGLFLGGGVVYLLRIWRYIHTIFYMKVKFQKVEGIFGTYVMYFNITFKMYYPLSPRAILGDSTQRQSKLAIHSPEVIQVLLGDTSLSCQQRDSQNTEAQPPKCTKAPIRENEGWGIPKSYPRDFLLGMYGL